MHGWTDKAAVAALAAAALVGGCKQEPAVDLKDKSVGEVAEAISTTVRPRPGLYDNRIEVVDVTMPNMPPEMQARMKETMARSMKSSQHCLTEEAAAKGYEEQLKQLAARPQCKFDHYTLAGGKLDAKLVCSDKNAVRATMTMQGTVSAEGSDMTMKSEQAGPSMPGMGGMAMTIHVTSKRIGECPAGAAANQPG
jgi:hypothetical protein